MIDWLEEHGHGIRKINYKLRDWLFSRQRYWGEPFPIIFSDGKTKTLADESLPVLLPEIEDFGTNEFDDFERGILLNKQYNDYLLIYPKNLMTNIKKINNKILNITQIK